MKKAVTILIIISVIAVALLSISYIAWEGNPPAWLFYLLLPFAIPLVGHSLSLAINRSSIQPKTWLIIYGVAFAAYLALILTFSEHLFT